MNMKCILLSLQKLYRFINYVELLSPHHAAKELMHSLRQGQITSLFQKSVKRVSLISICDLFLGGWRFC